MVFGHYRRDVAREEPSATEVHQRRVRRAERETLRLSGQERVPCAGTCERCGTDEVVRTRRVGPEGPTRHNIMRVVVNYSRSSRRNSNRRNTSPHAASSCRTGSTSVRPTARAAQSSRARSPPRVRRRTPPGWAGPRCPRSASTARPLRATWAGGAHSWRARRALLALHWLSSPAPSDGRCSPPGRSRFEDRRRRSCPEGSNFMLTYVRT